MGIFKAWLARAVRALPNRRIGWLSPIAQSLRPRLDGALADAVESFDYGRFKLALMLGADPGICAAIGTDYKLVTRVARSGEGEFLETLLDFGGLADAGLPSGAFLPVHMAASKGQDECVRILCRRGADPNALFELETGGARSALCMAVKQRKAGAMKALLDCGARMDLPDENGLDALGLCRKEGFAEGAEILSAWALGYPKK